MHVWKIRACLLFISLQSVRAQSALIGREVAIPQHLQDGEEFQVSPITLLRFGEQLFKANWTIQEGQGRPMAKGVATPTPISDPSAPLLFPRNFNRLSSPEANSCAGCHNVPVAGGAGDIVANVFVLAQRFDYVTMDHSDTLPMKGAVDESGNFVTLQSVANSRATPGMFGSGYLEMLAREITADLRAIESTIQPGGAAALVSKRISFGRLSRNADGTWDTSAVEGLPPQALASTGAPNPPSLILQPWHQVGNVVSLRQFTTNAFNHHHGMQATERFGIGVDQDGDGVVNELTRADITAATLFQAAMAAPGRVIPDDPAVQAAILNGETLFSQIGCAGCHIPSLPLKNGMYTEPNPYNPSGNLQPGQAPAYTMDLTDRLLPQPRLRPVDGVIQVAAFTDFKLHNITSGPGDPNAEPLNQNQAAGSAPFFAGNQFFLTKRLWSVGSSPNHYHHGRFTTMRESIMAHSGESQGSQQAFANLSGYDQGSIIEFLKTLKVLPPGSRSLIVDEQGQPIAWPPPRASLSAPSLASPRTASRTGNGLQLIRGHPVVDGVYINGHGPYRFLVDTGSQPNEVDLKLARSIGLQPDYQVEVVTPAGSTFVHAGRGMEVTLGSVRAGNEEFLYTDLRGVRQLSANIQGVLGEEFLARFDYLLDLKNHQLDIGGLEPEGIRVKFRTIDGRPSLFTSLGWLVLDSGADHLVLFGGKPAQITHLLWTASGSMGADLSRPKSLVIETQTIARTEAVVVPRQNGNQADGLLPGRLFRSIYVSNSKGYATLDCSNCYSQNRQQGGKVTKHNSISRKGA